MIDASILWDTKDNFAKLCNENEFATYNIFCGLQKPKRILFTMVIFVIKNWVMKDNLHFFAKLTLKNSTFFCKMRCSLDDPFFQRNLALFNGMLTGFPTLPHFLPKWKQPKQLNYGKWFHRFITKTPFRIVCTDIFDCSCTLFSWVSGLCTSMAILSWGHFLARISG